MNDTPLVVSFGGGVNSAAMLVGMRERGITPDLILFSDTGGERPETYETVSTYSRIWPIQTIRANSVDGTLEGACIKNHSLPSLAYGFKTCSQRWKLEPMEKFMRAWLVEHGQSRYIKATGIDAGEPHRAREYRDSVSETWFPLIEWQWGRRECVEAIERAGFPVPAKSACFFCPASKKSEVLRLKKEHPGLFWRAVAMERCAADSNSSVKGLGRRWSWEDLAVADEAQFRLFPEAPQIPCMCFEGEEDAA